MAADRLTRVTLELGGKNPAIVLKDASPSGLPRLMTGASKSGEICAASSRIFEAPLLDTLVSGLSRR